MPAEAMGPVERVEDYSEGARKGFGDEQASLASLSSSPSSTAVKPLQVSKSQRQEPSQPQPQQQQHTSPQPNHGDSDNNNDNINESNNNSNINNNSSDTGNGGDSNNKNNSSSNNNNSNRRLAIPRATSSLRSKPTRADDSTQLQAARSTIPTGRLQTHLLNRLEVENAYLANQNNLINKDFQYSRQTIQALRQILSQKEDTIVRMEEELRQTHLRSNFMESLLTEHNSLWQDAVLQGSGGVGGGGSGAMVGSIGAGQYRLWIQQQQQQRRQQQLRQQQQYGSEDWEERRGEDDQLTKLWREMEGPSDDDESESESESDGEGEGEGQFVGGQQSFRQLLPQEQLGIALRHSHIDNNDADEASDDFSSEEDSEDSQDLPRLATGPGSRFRSLHLEQISHNAHMSSLLAQQQQNQKDQQREQQSDDILTSDFYKQHNAMIDSRALTTTTAAKSVQDAEGGEVIEGPTRPLRSLRRRPCLPMRHSIQDAPASALTSASPPPSPPQQQETVATQRNFQVKECVGDSDNGSRVLRDSGHFPTEFYSINGELVDAASLDTQQQQQQMSTRSTFTPSTLPPLSSFSHIEVVFITSEEQVPHEDHTEINVSPATTRDLELTNGMGSMRGSLRGLIVKEEEEAEEGEEEEDQSGSSMTTITPSTSSTPEALDPSEVILGKSAMPLISVIATDIAIDGNTVSTLTQSNSDERTGASKTDKKGWTGRGSSARTTRIHGDRLIPNLFIKDGSSAKSDDGQKEPQQHRLRKTFSLSIRDKRGSTTEKKLTPTPTPTPTTTNTVTAAMTKTILPILVTEDSKTTVVVPPLIPGRGSRTSKFLTRFLNGFGKHTPPSRSSPSSSPSSPTEGVFDSKTSFNTDRNMGPALVRRAASDPALLTGVPVEKSNDGSQLRRRDSGIRRLSTRRFAQTRITSPVFSGMSDED
ncbi:hypothetical protein BGZ99_004958 [Dissophora globulifera]|uniref:Uncharacterized protein n=1 Tax=Dissophora globulifera TaxID=979702 RepID=A0A9P6RGG1_9FUNG|nr:hypothetical protein BGZ99_004958 [Dissophora globulifera]